MAKQTSGIHNSFSLRRFFLQSTHNNETNRNNRLNDIEQGLSKQEIAKAKNDDYTTRDDCSSDKQPTHFPEITGDELSAFCVICYLKESNINSFYTMDLCGHRFCTSCVVNYLKHEIIESRTDIACPQCSSAVHPNNIEYLLKDLPELKNKYEEFMIRRYLVSDPDSRWCPAPDCSFAVIAAGCASCPQIQCQRSGCGVSFCYHCKAEWHPDQTCDAARSSRNILRAPSFSYTPDSGRRDEIKPCPKCQVLIVKMNDGSCNHMVCSVCGAEFCWLCMKEVSDLHYLSPSGCTFWGKKPWSRKKKIVWQIGTLIGAPVGIALLAGIAVPSMVIGIPVWVGRKLLNRYKTKTKQKRNISVMIGVTASILISPLLAGLAIAIGVPILLFYVYGVVPVSLCRAGCGASAGEEFKFDGNINNESHTQYNGDEISIDAVSRIGETSIGDVSLSATSGSLIETVNNKTIHNNQRFYRVSTTALAGSVGNQKIKFGDDISTESISAATLRSDKSAADPTSANQQIA